MKKVISALTAATMVASMSASVISAFAVYSPENIAFYLKANPSSYYTTAGKQKQTANFTVSDDGKTITFATAADAAGAKLGIGAYVKMSTENPSIQQVVGTVKTDSDKIHFIAGENASLMKKVDGDEELTYTDADGEEFTADRFVNTFGSVEFDEYSDNTMTVQTVKKEKNELKEGLDGFAWIWGPTIAPGAESANFLAATSDAYPMMEFTITLDDAIADGTYTVDYAPVAVNDYGDYSSTLINDGEGEVVPGTMEGLTIVVGSGEKETDPQQESESQLETDPQQESESQLETDPQQQETDPQQQETDQPQIDGYTWKIDDVVFENPDASNKKSNVKVPIRVYNDPGTYGVQFRILIDGKAVDDEACPFVLNTAKSGGGYTRVGSVVVNPANGRIALSISADPETQVEDESCVNGESAITLTVVPKAGVTYVPGTKYAVTFDTVSKGDENEAMFSNAAKADLMPSLTLLAGSITIPGEQGVTEPTEETETTQSETETAQSETETAQSETETAQSETDATPSEGDTPVPGDYVYGDVNKNGKVELVDIVMLNRFLTKYDNQTLDAYQVEVANCAGNAAPGEGKSTEADLNGDDSIEILKYLIGLVASLPSKG